MAWTKTKTAVVIGVGLLLAAGTATMVRIERHNEAKQYVLASEPWSDDGAATPRAALESLAWALTHGKIDRALELMQWDEKGTEYGGDPAFAHRVAIEGSLDSALEDIESFRILSIKPGRQAGEMLVKMEKTFKDRNIVPFAVTTKLRRAGGQWRVVAEIEYYKGGNTSMRLPFTGSFE